MGHADAEGLSCLPAVAASEHLRQEPQAWPRATTLSCLPAAAQAKPTQG